MSSNHNGNYPSALDFVGFLAILVAFSLSSLWSNAYILALALTAFVASRYLRGGNPLWRDEYTIGVLIFIAGIVAFLLHHENIAMYLAITGVIVIGLKSLSGDKPIPTSALVACGMSLVFLYLAITVFQNWQVPLAGAMLLGIVLCAAFIILRLMEE